jgi:regulator of protease activity HflC (stomatin/prohibitin superfamily)
MSLSSFILYPFIFLGIIVVLASFFIVKQQTAAIIERFGRFQSIRQSGLQLKIPLIALRGGSA